MNKKFERLAIGAAVSLFACQLAAAAEAEKPKPGPEHERLGYYVGNWKTEGEVKPGSMGPGGKMTVNNKCEWFDGKFAVICHGTGSSPMGPFKGIDILSYSADDKAYTYYGLDSSGMAMTTVPHGTVNGKTWTYTDESKMGGQMMKTRVTINEVSPTRYTFKMEEEGKDGKWATVMESTSTKTP